MTAGTKLYLAQKKLGFHHAYNYNDSRSVMYRLYRLDNGRYEIEADCEPLDEEWERPARETAEIFDAPNENAAQDRLLAYVAAIEESVDRALAAPDPEDLAYDREIELAERRGCGE